MRKNMDWAPGPGGVERDGDSWVISAAGPEVGFCPGCHEPSRRRHSRYFRHLQDLPVQGAGVVVKMQVSRWRCLNAECERRTFTDQLPEIVCPYARRTQRIAELVYLIGHGTGGRPAERLMKRLGMSVSDDTILRHLKRQVARLRARMPVRVAGIDDWSWRRGRTYGTIIVDLERREVVDVLQDRTTAGTAEWLRQHPEVEIVSRDRCGLYAQGAREGAPQARQVADRFHLLQNLRETIETQLSRADGIVMSGMSPADQGLFRRCAGRGCGHVFGLSRGELDPPALMLSADPLPPSRERAWLRRQCHGLLDQSAFLRITSWSPSIPLQRCSWRA